MAQQPDEKDDDTQAKEQIAAQLLYQLYQQSPLVFRNRAQNMLAKHKEDILKWGDQLDSEDNQITEEQFVAFLDGKMSAILAKVVFSMIYAAKDDDKKGKPMKVARVDVVKFAQGFKSKKHVRAVTVKDANWVLKTIQKTDFADIDQNDEFKIDLEKFQQYFKDVGISHERIAAIFEEIDTKKQGYITVVAYEKWRSQQKADKLLITLNK